MSVKQIKLITLFIILSIIAGACSALFIVNGTTVDAVENLAMAESTSSTVSVNWEKVNKAEGYRIYLKNKDSKEFEKYQDVKGEDNCSINISDLKSAAVYDVKVTAFKLFRGDEIESEASQNLTVYTLPDKINLEADSEGEGVLNLKWSPLKNVAGYEIEYSKNEKFDKKESTIEKDSKAKLLKIKGLKPMDVYYSRIRSYIEFNGKKIYGEWSDINQTEIKDKMVMGSNIDPNKPIVALSFDDGPGYPFDNGVNPTNEILDVLEEYGARATFFMCGARIQNSNKNCLKREIELGCEIGSHTYNHEHYGKNVTAKDISKNTECIKKACGQAPTIFRCPGGMMTKTIQKECKKEGMPIAYWSVDTEDWKSKDPKAIYNIATKHVYDGSIILMHDIYPTTAKAVKKIVPKLIEEGYQIVTVSEMLAVKNGKQPKAGQQYVDYKTINNNT